MRERTNFANRILSAGTGTFLWEAQNLQLKWIKEEVSLQS